ncbi:hypothetical protein [Petrachloros mirabilis]
MLLKEGDKILIAHRRLFEKDVLRFFIGEVQAYDAGLVKATGHSYVRDPMGGQVVEKAEKRTKILSLSSGTFIVYQLPDGIVLNALKFSELEGRLALTDGEGFTMNLTETTHSGRL